MKHKILDAVQIIAAIVLTTGIAYALPAQPVVTDKPASMSSEVTAEAKTPTPVTQEKAAEPTPVAEVTAKVETPAPVEQAPVQEPAATDQYSFGGQMDWFNQSGINPADYRAVDYILSRESGWCAYKWQGEIGGCPKFHGTPADASVGYGLCQSTPGWKMADAGADWATNPVTQLKWCNTHADGHGGWGASYQYWLNNHNW
jgi:hypothetical protein